MGEIKIRYLETRSLADGSIAYYYCPPRRAVKAGIVVGEALGADPIKAAARAEYLNERVDDWRAGKDLQVEKNAHGTIDWLVLQFEKSEKFLRLDPVTRRDYSGRLTAFSNLEVKGKRLGVFMARSLTAAHADKIYLRLQAPAKEGGAARLAGANGILRVVRRMFSLAVRWEAATINPFAKMGMKAAPSRDVVMSPAEIETFCAKAIEMDRRSLAILVKMTFELAQRLGDMRRFPWSRYNGHEVQVRQKKTDRVVWVSLVPDLLDLKTLLDETPRTSTVIVVNERTGKPYTAHDVSRAFNEVRDAAGLPDHYRAGDMRRSGLDEAGDAGSTDDEIRSLSGHASREVVAAYVKPSRTKAASATRKRREHRQKHLDRGA